MIRSLKKVLTVLVVVSAMSSAAANAASINYGSFAGTTLSFNNVEESSLTDAPPLFGTPSVSGDAILFNPSSFGATSSNGGLPDITDGHLSMLLMANPGFGIDSIEISEAGDYTLIGAGGAGTMASVSAPVFLTITEVNFAAITPINMNGNLVFSPSGGSYDLANDGPGVGVIWTGSLNLDISGYLNDVLGINGVATKIEFDMDNTLVALSETGTISFIQKKQIGGFGMTVTTIPVPSAIYPGMALLAGLGVMRRRRQA